MLIRSANGGSGWVSCSPPQEGELGGVIENSVVADVTATSPNPSSRGGGKSTMPQKLSDIQIFELSRLIVQIENHYGFPCDIEWAWANGQFYITQSRPITTLNVIKSPTTIIKSVRDYQRLFQWRGGGLPYLFSDLYMQTYKSLGCVIISKNGIWTNYLPNRVVTSTLTIGVDLLSSEEKFLVYKNDFEYFREESRVFFQDVITWKDVDQMLFDRAIEFFARLFIYYSKAEFFYSDKAYAESSKNETLGQNLLEMAKIKEWGRSLMNEMFFSSGNYFDTFLTLLGVKFGLGLKDIKFHGVFELRQLFHGQGVLSEEIARRKDAFIFHVEHGQVSTLSGREVDTFLSFFLESEQAARTILQGTVANSGRYTGLVKVIHYGYEDFEAVSAKITVMNQGDVLVAESTSPELLLACKKAGAILTNQGGLLSHAAIISRELAVPCIVGLGNATDILHDGDLVEVDATNGVVRILEKANG
ncbi:MAG: hypothetical protein JNK33_01495, partial [Candidatus Doudnabacteria bacterium]|nr:hypothetical protein [Candidatus Doudnabacteria bacterium]